eukprot:TRINITY_DN11135_c0_g1_i4.p1 TRINITY_DN11135_c0_g1~~TRINITY_DN11135_c0_g1_i4.p1  ORF type:complete len:243 (-),score=40.50 TRINITY_DN11135_c0_g1_i4:38-712(-)
MDKGISFETDRETKKVTKPEAINSAEELRSKARVLERKLDRLIEAFSEDDDAQDDFVDAKLIEIETNIDELVRINTSLTRVDNASHSFQHHVTKLRHYRSVYKQILDRVKHKRERSQLLYTNNQNDEGLTITMDRYIDDNRRISGVIKGSEDILEQGLATKQKLIEGRMIIEKNISQLGVVNGVLSLIHGTMNQIKRKKYKNVLILGAVISFCVCFLLWWWLSS